jgi:mannose-6-phosphate isomerase-like protein (cupin superfamily)
MSAYAVAHLDEIPKRSGWIPIRDHFGVAAFGINAWQKADAGETVIDAHTELMTRHEELYVVLDGHAAFTVGGEEVDAPAGTLVFVGDPATRRQAVAKEPGTTVLVIGAEPGKPFTVSPWEETWEPNQEAMVLYREQRYADAADVLRKAIAEHPDAAALLYNLACFESMAGADASTVAGHLRRSIGLYPGFRAFARGDSDFDPVRDNPQIAAVLEEDA